MMKLLVVLEICISGSDAIEMNGLWRGGTFPRKGAAGNVMTGAPAEKRRSIRCAG